ncbi:MAG: hypothetical protein KVP17_000810 [Porospora cf. gigantea B]|uniref:uncharacterized protein n=1 Tax=Porospora cf. gigantea B TaxID=2853592 RepID=UPI0035718BEC|nr:MAG: hypothetical protein KVP17_000810 [Porospora cf. gigantea B]
MKVSPPNRTKPLAALSLACLSPGGIISDMYSGSPEEWLARSTDCGSPAYFGSDTMPDARRSPTPLASVIPRTSDNLVTADTYSRYAATSPDSFHRGSTGDRSSPNAQDALDRQDWTRTAPQAKTRRLQATPVTNYSGRPPNKFQAHGGPSFVKPAASGAPRYNV